MPRDDSEFMRDLRRAEQNDQLRSINSKLTWIQYLLVAAVLLLTAILEKGFTP